MRGVTVALAVGRRRMRRVRRVREHAGGLPRTVPREALGKTAVVLVHFMARAGSVLSSRSVTTEGSEPRSFL